MAAYPFRLSGMVVGKNNNIMGGEYIDAYLGKDFLGKDSIRYVNTINVDNIVYENIKLFTKDKNKNDDVFDLIKSKDINNYLKQYMTGLTAKVFRTYNASNVFSNELENI